MPSPFEDQRTEPLSSPGQAAPRGSSDPAAEQTWIFTQPGGVQPNTQPPPPRPQRSQRRRIWYIVSGAAVLCVVLGIVLTSTLNASRQGNSTLPGGTSSFTPGAYDSPNSRLFSNASPWNVPIGNNVQLDANSSGMVSQLANCCHVPALYQFGMPIYTSTASDPSYRVQDNGHDDLFQSHQPIHIPDDAAPSPGSDHWLFIYDKTQNLLFEMWQAQKDGNTWSTNTGDVYSPTGDGVLQADGSQQSGNGASYFGGVITDADMQRGYINHALSLASQYTASTWRYPMNASDGHGTDPNDVPMGARIQLDPSVDCNALSGASVGETMICQALQTYGGYMRDTGGVALSMYFEGEDGHDPARNPPDGSPGNAGRRGGIFGSAGLRDGKDLSDIPWDKLRVLKSWNSFTALNSASPSAPPVPLAAFSAGQPALRQANITGLSIGETARSRPWLHLP